MAVSAIAEADRFLYLTPCAPDDEQRRLVEDLRRVAVAYRDTSDKVCVRLKRAEARATYLLQVLLEGDGVSPKRWKQINAKLKEIDNEATDAGL
jgi:hypothetical protein